MLLYQTQERRLRKPIILTVASTGAAYSAEKYPNIPVTPEAIVKDARACFAEGARVFHVHARNPATGKQFANLNYYRDVTTALRRELGQAPIIYPTSRKGEVEAQIQEEIARNESRFDSTDKYLSLCVEAELLRAIGMYASPDRITTFTAPDILIGGDAYNQDYLAATASYSETTRKAWKDPAVARAYFHALTKNVRALGISEEVEISTWKAFDVIEEIGACAALALPNHLSFVLLLGFSARLPIEKSVYEASLERIQQISKRFGIDVTITVAAVIAPSHAYSGDPRRKGDVLPPNVHDYREVIEWVARDSRVDSFRVGLEDTPEIFGKKLSNADLVAHAREVFAEFGVETEADVMSVRRAMMFDYKRPSRSAISSFVLDEKQNVRAI